LGQGVKVQRDLPQTVSGHAAHFLHHEDLSAESGFGMAHLGCNEELSDEGGKDSG
jgi:hypothetical protein